MQRLPERPTRPLRRFIAPEEIREVLPRNGTAIEAREVDQEREWLPTAKRRFPVVLNAPTLKDVRAEGSQAERGG